MKIGIIGYGRIGKLYFSILNTKYPQSEIVFCDNKEEGCINNYKDISFSDCSIVIISTPPHNHYEICDYFILNTRSCVVLEKPAVIYEEDMFRLSQMYDIYSNKIYFAYHTLFNPLFKNNLNEQSFDNIIIESKENVVYYHGINSWIYNESTSGGGCIIDSGVNIFSVLCSIVPNLKVIKCSVKFKTLPVEDYANIKMSSNKTKVQIYMDWNYQESEVRNYIFENINQKHVIDIANGLSTTMNKSRNSLAQNVVDQKSEYELLIEDFMSFFNNGKSKINFHPLLPLKLVFDCYKLAE